MYSGYTPKPRRGPSGDRGYALYSNDLIKCFWNYFTKPRLGEIYNIGGGRKSNCSVIEALSAGIPVLASQSHGGINEIINNKNFGNIYNNKNELLKFYLQIFHLKL